MSLFPATGLQMLKKLVLALSSRFNLGKIIRTTIKIFKFLHSSYCISGQYVLCRKENRIVREYILKCFVLSDCNNILIQKPLFL